MLCQTPKKRVADNSVPICKQNPISLLVSFAAAAAATIHHSHRCRTLAVTMFFVCASATTASAFGKLIKKLQFCENAFVSFVYHNFVPCMISRGGAVRPPSTATTTMFKYGRVILLWRIGDCLSCLLLRHVHLLLLIPFI